MKKNVIPVLFVMLLIFPDVPLAEDKELLLPPHRYWVCSISSYNSFIDGKYQESKCRANTEYSKPPCREFVVEFEGEGGIRPGMPFKQTVGCDMKKSPLSSPNEAKNQAQSTTTTIQINEKDGQYLYVHTIETDNISKDRWVYQGNCKYYKAPINEKIYLDKGLKTAS